MTRKALDQTLDFVRRIDRAQTSDDVCAVLLDTVGCFGFRNILAGMIPAAGLTKRQQEAHVLLKHWPKDWCERYFGSGYLFVDPTIRRVLSGSVPFFWSDIVPACKDDLAGMQVMNEAGDFQLCNGFTVSLVTLECEAAGFSFAGDHIELPPDKRATVQLLANYSLGRTLLLRDNQPDAPLTRREMDVLRWSAEGKTDWEISVILGVSEHTVDKMGRLVRHKLKTVNRAHTVAEGIRLGIID